jgi:HlyD family secretion protein
MSTDVYPETERGQHRGRPQVSSAGGWWKYGLLALGAGCLLAVAGVLILGASSAETMGPMRTHTIERGELLFTIVEQGVLGSSDDTEIICKVRGDNTINWVIESGTKVEAGEDLIKLDTLLIEEAILEWSKFSHLAEASAEGEKAAVARAKLAISEYQEGRFVAELMTLEKDLAIAESRLRTSQNILGHATMLADRGYVSGLEIEQKKFGVVQSELVVEMMQTNIDVLKRFTRREELERLKGVLNTTQAKYSAEAERVKRNSSQRDRAIEELKYCVVRAEKSGMVIHPTVEDWDREPEITEGGTVHKDQVMLLMPDLTKMQVQVGIHESIIDRIKPGQTARITLPGKVLVGTVTSVSSVAQPAGWWNGNMVKYDTIIMLPSMEELLLEEIQRRGEKIPVAERTALQQTLETDQQERTEVQRKLVDDAQVEYLPDYKALKPGMNAKVEVTITRHLDVLTIPVTAVVETETGQLCWVRTDDGVERRSLELGDGNTMSIVVKSGLQEGDEVVLNPTDVIEEAHTEVQKTRKSVNRLQQYSSKPKSKTVSQ